MGNCKIKDDCLQKQDSIDYRVGDWGKIHNETEIYCTICSSVFIVNRKGFQAVLQHS